jgi:RimJ/RimL family protein N-acetyltransferase
MKYFKKIAGERVYLSPINPADLEIYTKWLNDREISDRLGDGCLMINLETEKKWIEDALKNGDHSYAIVLNETDELLGNIGLFEVKQMYGTATVGLFIGESENRGKGYGTEALKLLTGYAFDVLNLRNIMLCVYEFNEAAYKSYLKAGFKEMGKRRKAYYLNNKYHDIIYMDITREDWYKNEQ